MKKYAVLFFLLFVTSFVSCNRAITLFFFSNEDVDILVNGEYIGNGLSGVTLSNNETICVTCEREGIAVYERTLHVRNFSDKQLIELNISPSYKYSSNNSKGL